MSEILKFKERRKILKGLYGLKAHEILGGRINGMPVAYVNIPNKGYIAVDQKGNAYRAVNEGSTGAFHPNLTTFEKINLTNYDRGHIYKAATRNNGMTSFGLALASRIADYWAKQGAPKPAIKSTPTLTTIQEDKQTPTVDTVTTKTNRTGKVNNRINRNINRPDYAKNFVNFLFSPEEIAYMKSLNYDPTDARSVQEFILSKTPNANLGVRKGIGKTDGLWGDKSIAAFKALREQGIFTPKADELKKPVVEQPVVDASDPFGYSTTNHYGDGMALKELGFNNYSGLKNYVIANLSNQFAKDLKQRFGNDVNAWNQTDVENALGVSGTYRGGYAGDFGDMARSMARWAGETNAAYDTRKETSVAKPTFNTQEMLNNIKSLKFTTPEWKFSLNQGNIGASTLGSLPSTRPESNNLDWMKYAQQTGYLPTE